MLVAASLLFTTVAPTYALSSSAAAPALAGLPSAPAPGGETSGEGAGNVSPYDVNNVGGVGMMALTSVSDEPKSAKFEPPETPYNGAFTRGFDLEVPPFFELTPKLHLGYNSGDNRQHSGDGFSLLGVGWTLSGGGLIERKSKRGGLPRFDATDTFELDGNSLLDCVENGVARETPSCSAAGTHTACYESYERIKYIAATNNWEVTGRDGRRSTYKPLATFAPSGTEDARLRNNYRWLLQAVTDTDGNTVSYSYDCSALPTCYVAAISYGTSTVQFYWETRTDPFTHATGISLANVTKRLKTVAVKAGTSLIRAYDLAYAISPDTKRSLLTAFKQYGSDATLSGAGVVTAGTSLPADSFTYLDMKTRRMGTMISDLVTANTAVEGTPSTSVRESGSQDLVPGSPNFVGDFNGDGKDDLLTATSIAEGGCELRYFPSGLWTSNQYGYISGYTVVPTNSVMVPFQLCSSGEFAVVGDFDGNGRDEVGAFERISSSTPQALRSQMPGLHTNDLFFGVIRLNGASITGISVTGIGPGNLSTRRPVLVGDFDGDGRTDLFWNRVYVSNGSGFVGQDWANQSYGKLGDFNGDGLTDFMVLDGVNGVDTYFLLSTGSGFEPVPLNEVLTSRGDYPWPEFEIGTQHYGHVGQWIFGDFNGDGVTDFIVQQSWGTKPLALYETAGRGVGKSTLTSYNPPDSASDVNGDGRSDGLVHSSYSIYGESGEYPSFEVRVRSAQSLSRVCNGGSYSSTADFNGDGKPHLPDCQHTNDYNIGPDSVMPDLLKRHTLRTGGTVDVEYLPSTYWTNGYLPFVVQAVSKVTTSDGLGNSSKVKYAYEGGAYDAFERKFLGFAKVTAELPCETGEPTCPWVHAWYRQEAVAAGSLSKLEVYAPNGQIQRRVENGYVVNQASAPFTAFKTSEQVTEFLTGGNAVSRKEWTYDGYANLVEEKDLGVVGWTGDDLTTSTGYELNLGAYIVDRPGRVTATDAVGTLLRDTQVFYDGTSSAGVEPSKGHATTTRKWLTSESRWIAAMAEYDSFGQPTAETDPLGNRTERLYDATHQFVTEERNPLWFDDDTRQKQLASWNTLCAAPATQTDGNGLVTRYQYDALCRQTRVDYPSGDYLTTAFFNLGTATTQYVESKKSPADGVNPIWSRTYLDGQGRSYKQTGIGATAAAQPVVTETKYTKRGEVRQTSLPYFQGSTAQWTTTKYDVLSRPMLVTLPDSKTMTYAYSAIAYAAGYLTQTAVTDPLSRTSYQRRDAAGRVLQDVGQVGGAWVVTSLGYNPLGELTSVTDPMGNVWTNTYDTLGRRTAANDPDLGIWTYAYDDAGRLLTQTDAKAQVTAFGYDRLGRVLTKTSGVGLPNAETISNTYDQARSGFYNLGQLTTAANDNAVYTYDYDNGGRQARLVRTVDGVAYTQTTGYDPGGRVTSRLYADGSTAGPFGYNAAGQQVSLSGAVTSTSYDAAGNVLSIAYANGVATTYTYSATRVWLNTVSTVKGGTIIQSVTYTRDFAGRITGIDGNRLEDDWTYSYDALDHLLSAANTNTPVLSQTFTYDLGGKLTSNSSVGSYVYPAQGSSAVRPHAVSTAGSWSFSYDLNGNQLSRATSGATDRTLGYDADNRPVSVTLDGTTTAYLYGPDGELLKKLTPSGTTLYLGDSERDPAGSWTDYVTADVKRAAGALNWLHRDHLSSVRRITDATGALTRSSVYQPYGKQTETVVAPLSPAEPKGWIGERTDPETGLTYLHARYYDASLGRFLSPDWWDPSDPGVGTDRYGYSLGDPVNKSDPNGHVAETITLWDWFVSIFSGTGASATLSTASKAVPIVGTAAAVAWVMTPTTVGAGEDEWVQANLRSGGVVLAEKATDDGAARAGEEGECRSCPNPYGKKGKPDHQAAVDAAEKELIAKYGNNDDIDIVREKEVMTPGGHKEVRYLDVAAVTKDGHVIEGIQVGRTNKDGTPVSRERKAMNDIRVTMGDGYIVFNPIGK